MPSMSLLSSCNCRHAQSSLSDSASHRHKLHCMCNRLRPGSLTSYPWPRFTREMRYIMMAVACPHSSSHPTTHICTLGLDIRYNVPASEPSLSPLHRQLAVSRIIDATHTQLNCILATVYKKLRPSFVSVLPEFIVATKTPSDQQQIYTPNKSISCQHSFSHSLGTPTQKAYKQATTSA